jgi:hypothetical protein
MHESHNLLYQRIQTHTFYTSVACFCHAGNLKGNYVHKLGMLILPSESCHCNTNAFGIKYFPATFFGWNTPCSPLHGLIQVLQNSVYLQTYTVLRLQAFESTKNAICCTVPPITVTYCYIFFTNDFNVNTYSNAQ